jgi:hypothetical protein
LALRKTWQRKTGRQIERLTPPGYNDKLAEKRRLAREARLCGNVVIDQITAGNLGHDRGVLHVTAGPVAQSHETAVAKC